MGGAYGWGLGVGLMDGVPPHRVITYAVYH